MRRQKCCVGFQSHHPKKQINPFRYSSPTEGPLYLPNCPPCVLPNTKAKAPAATPGENAEENENICNILFQIALKRRLGGISVRPVFVLRVRDTVFSACVP